MCEFMPVPELPTSNIMNFFADPEVGPVADDPDDESEPDSIVGPPDVDISSFSTNSTNNKTLPTSKILQGCLSFILCDFIDSLPIMKALIVMLLDSDIVIFKHFNSVLIIYTDCSCLSQISNCCCHFQRCIRRADIGEGIGHLSVVSFASVPLLGGICGVCHVIDVLGSNLEWFW